MNQIQEGQTVKARRLGNVNRSTYRIRHIGGTRVMGGKEMVAVRASRKVNSKSGEWWKPYESVSLEVASILLVGAATATERES